MTDTVKQLDLSWYEKAGCRGLPSNLFFLNCESGVDGIYDSLVERTQNICAQCEVVRECFNHALANDESYGVWGGADFQVRGKANRRLSRRLRFLKAQHQKVLRKAKKLRDER